MSVWFRFMIFEVICGWIDEAWVGWGEIKVSKFDALSRLWNFFRLWCSHVDCQDCCKARKQLSVFRDKLGFHQKLIFPASWCQLSSHLGGTWLCCLISSFNLLNTSQKRSMTRRKSSARCLIRLDEFINNPSCFHLPPSCWWNPQMR